MTAADLAVVHLRNETPHTLRISLEMTHGRTVVVVSEGEWPIDKTACPRVRWAGFPCEHGGCINWLWEDWAGGQTGVCSAHQTPWTEQATHFEGVAPDAGE